jgi:hypothetical protein
MRFIWIVRLIVSVLVLQAFAGTAVAQDSDNSIPAESYEADDASYGLELSIENFQAILGDATELLKEIADLTASSSEADEEPTTIESAYALIKRVTAQGSLAEKMREMSLLRTRTASLSARFESAARSLTVASDTARNKLAVLQSSLLDLDRADQQNSFLLERNREVEVLSEYQSQVIGFMEENSPSNLGSSDSRPGTESDGPEGIRDDVVVGDQSSNADTNEDPEQEGPATVDWVRMVASEINSDGRTTLGFGERAIERLTPESLLQTLSEKLTELQVDMTEESNRTLSKRNEIAPIVEALKGAIANASKSIAMIEPMRTELADALSVLDRESSFLLEMNQDQSGYVRFTTTIFAILVGGVIAGFFIIAFKTDNLREAIFGDDRGIQFITLFALVIAIILFGILGILEGKELSALLGGLSGYILGRGSINPSRGQQGSNPAATPAAQREGGGAAPAQAAAGT